MSKPILPAVDPSTATRRADGKHEIVLRCRLPFRFDARFTMAAKPAPADGGDGEMPGDMPTMPAGYGGPKLAGPTITGTASSTGKDAYGTEMSKAALDSMAGQFQVGVPYLPKHPSFMGGDGEWGDVIGYTVGAEVASADVPTNAPDEPGFTLGVTVQLDGTDPRCAELVKRIQRGYPIGQSIGGWFTEIRFLYADGDDPEDWMTMPERMIVEGVELDHLAATRAPANLESWITGAKEMLSDFAARSRTLGQRRAVPPPVVVPAPDPLAERSRILLATRAITDAIGYRPADQGASRCDGCAHFTAGADGATTGTCGKWTFATPGDYTSDGFEPRAGSEAAAVADATAGDHVDAAAPPPADVRAAIPYADLPLADATEPWVWDAAAQDAVLGDPPDWVRYKQAHTWYDSANAETKGAYKLPIAKMFGGTLKAVWNGVHAAMGTLNGARGGANIPDADRQAVYDHLKRYYDRFGKEAPELKSAPIPTAEVDTSAETGHDSPTDAHRGALTPPVRTGAEEPSMTEAEINAMVEAKVRAALAAAPPPAPAPADEAVALRARLAETEARLADALAQPVRRGTSALHIDGRSPLASTEYDTRIQAADAVGARSLAIVCRSKGFLDRRAVEADRPGTKVDRGALEDDLRSLLAAGVADGLITELDESTAGWRR